MKKLKRKHSLKFNSALLIAVKLWDMPIQSYIKSGISTNKLYMAIENAGLFWDNIEKTWVQKEPDWLSRLK